MSLFRFHGEFCASHPWEVIVATLTLTACFLSIESVHQKPFTNQDFAQEFSPVDAISMTIIRCVAVLYSYYQFRNLHKLGSKYILGIAGLFTVFSSFVFSTTVINYLTGDLSDLKDALFCFLLLIDLSKATLLAQFALSASTTEQVKLNIAKGMAHLGPSLTLDTIVETLVISVGTLSGIRRLETLCYFACVSVVVNYIVFMTFYPSCLSLILELSKNYHSETLAWHHSFKVITELKDHEHKPNPVLERVKLIMSGGLVFVHVHSRLLIRDIDEKESVLPLISPDTSMELDSSRNYLLHWIALSADHIVVLILLLALTVKFIFFEDKDDIILCETLSNSGTSTNEKCLSDKMVQTEAMTPMLYTGASNSSSNDSNDNRSYEDCLFLYKIKESAEGLSDQEVSLLVNKGVISVYQLEKVLKNPERGVEIRRHILGSKYGLTEALTYLPYKNYNYSKVMGTCCENVIGYVPVPVGLAGPLLLDGKHVIIPMATTEGCLVASTNRGCRALSSSGVTTRIVADGMTRGPVVRFPSAARASQAMAWIQDKHNFIKIKESFDSTSRFARLQRVQSRIAGRHLFLRFVATTGDAMGMNMTSKATECALIYVRKLFPDMELISLSGNYCSDKKPAAVNWIEGRGKSVVCEAIVNKDIVKSVLKTSVKALVDVNISKNLIGSAVAGSIGGNNAHAANIVTAIFIATGQDPAQNVGSSNCITLMEAWGPEEDLYISCTMPSIEIGTVGGGTQLEGQSACLDIVGARGPHLECPGENANKLARIVCAGVLAGELSLMSALASGALVESHLRHNRSNVVQCQSS